MEHNRSTKVVAIIALLVGVLGLSVGFSAYSKVLNIQNVQATVKGASSNFNVHFSTSSSASTSTGQITGSGSSGVGSGSATLTATDITGLTATFNSKGDIVYTFGVFNNGGLKAYLKKVTIPSTATCTTSNATNTLVQDACKDIKVKISVGGTEYSSTTDNIQDKTGLGSGSGAAVVVTITNGGVHPVDGDFTATFGTISLEYSTQPAAAA